MRLVRRITLCLTVVTSAGIAATHAETQHEHQEDPAHHEAEQHAAEHHDHHEGEDPRSVPEHRAEMDHEHGEGADRHGHGEHVDVSALGRRLAGIRIDRVTERTLSGVVELPGEIGFNEDRLAHITPRYGGVVKQVLKHLGDSVEEGETLAVIEGNESLTRYSVRAPLRGSIVEKHAAPGEYVSEETSLYVIADLATVWVNLSVYPRHLEHVSRGDDLKVRAVGVDQETAATISYVAPVFDKAKRAAVARAILENPGGVWRPGMFVRGELEVASEGTVTAVESDAVQVLDGNNCVFIPAGPNQFTPVEVAVGTAGLSHVEILSGLAPGDRYVADGAFELKAKMVTSSLGSHAGHGH
jgi:cobalt-zinc-cadmium efflux system membrane fusion protein